MPGGKRPLPQEDNFPRSPRRVLFWLAAGSGAAALIYEITWFQILELVVGSSAVSLGILLATFMGGTCLGSLIFPRLALRYRHPLRVYAAIEIGIGVLGLLVLLVAPYVGSVYTAWSGYGLPGFLLRGIVAAICLLPPTLLMGATLPALARQIKTTPGPSGDVSWLGFFYGGNIAGAVLGCLLAGFYLLREYDVTTATLVAVAINVGVAAMASLLAAATPAPRIEEAARGSIRLGQNTAVYVAIAVSGFCALAAESIWTRILGLLLGSSVYTFTIILTVFLVGLGIGSGAASVLCRTLKRPRRALGWCQLLLAAAIAWTAFSLSSSLPYWPISPEIASDIWINFQLDIDRALWALLPPTLLWGASFPFAMAAVSSEGRDPARLMSSVYAANTLGAILGALSASLLLVAWVGSQRVEQLLIALSVIAGLVLVLPGRAILGVAAVLLTGFMMYSVPPVSQVLIAHGRFAATWVGRSDIVYSAEGLNASVAVSDFPNGVRTFHVAGKIQASNVPRDMRLQRMLGHLTTLTASHPRSVLVIGCGAGVTAGAVSLDPRVERETIVEIEPLVPQAASQYFGSENFGVVGNSKVRVHIDDGRHYLLTTTERFDAITADPLDPWVKGAANLYTKEFFEVAKQRLNPGGVITMYVQLFETNAAAVKSLVATFLEVFPDGTMWGNTVEGKGHDMVLLGQAGPLRIDLDETDRRLTSPEYSRLAESLAGVGMRSALNLFETYAGRKSDLTEWLKDAAINRDRNLRMQYLAGFGLNLDESAGIYADMVAHRKFPDDLFSSAEGRVDFLRARVQSVDR